MLIQDQGFAIVGAIRPALDSGVPLRQRQVIKGWDDFVNNKETVWAPGQPDRFYIRYTIVEAV